VTLKTTSTTKQTYPIGTSNSKQHLCLTDAAEFTDFLAGIGMGWTNCDNQYDNVNNTGTLNLI
jgi:hypothetical protein